MTKVAWIPECLIKYPQNRYTMECYATHLGLWARVRNCTNFSSFFPLPPLFSSDLANNENNEVSASKIFVWFQKINFFGPYGPISKLIVSLFSPCSGAHFDTSFIVSFQNKKSDLCLPQCLEEFPFVKKSQKKSKSFRCFP